MTPESTGIEEPATPLGFLVRGDQGVALALHLSDHFVERPAEKRDLVVALLLAHAHVEIAPADTLGGAGKPADRSRKTFREPQAGPDRGKDDDHGEADVDEGELEQELAAVGFELLVEPDGRCVSSSRLRIFPSTSRLT